jgi:glucosylceramidase
LIIPIPSRGILHCLRVCDLFDNVRLVHDAWPEKALRFTEGTEGAFYPDSLQEWKWGEVFGRSMINDYLGQFSKFIRPGARRIICSSNTDDLIATAAINQDGRIAVVVMNQTETDIPFNTWIANESFKTTGPAHSVMTIVL